MGGLFVNASERGGPPSFAFLRSVLDAMILLRARRGDRVAVRWMSRPDHKRRCRWTIRPTPNFLRDVIFLTPLNLHITGQRLDKTAQEFGNVSEIVESIVADFCRRLKRISAFHKCAFDFI